MDFWSTMFSDEEYEFCEYKSKGVGSGRSNNGQRRKWKKNYYFEQDLFILFQQTLDHQTFAATYAGYKPAEILWFFNKIKHNALRPKETEWHCRNKFLLWLDKMHNVLSYHQIRAKYYVGVATAKCHITDILQAILKSFKDENIVRFPNASQREKMVKILKARGVEMPDAWCSMDGSHVKCSGRRFKERLSHKYKNTSACFNVLFIVERVLGTICAFNIDASARKHDITVLRESWFYQYLDEIMDGWVILADKGYLGVRKDGLKCIAAVLRKNMKGRNAFSDQFWHRLSVARSESERIFSHFFWNKFKQLCNWSGKSKNTFIEFGANLTCCVILYNSVKFEFQQTPLI